MPDDNQTGGVTDKIASLCRHLHSLILTDSLDRESRYLIETLLVSLLDARIPKHL